MLINDGQGTGRIAGISEGGMLRTKAVSLDYMHHIKDHVHLPKT